MAAVVAGATSAVAAVAVETQATQAAGAAGAARRSLRPARRVSCMSKGFNNGERFGDDFVVVSLNRSDHLRATIRVRVDAPRGGARWTTARARVQA